MECKWILLQNIFSVIYSKQVTLIDAHTSNYYLSSEDDSFLEEPVLVWGDHNPTTLIISLQVSAFSKG